MGLLSRVKTWITGEVLTASDLNGEFNNILNNLDPSKVDDASSDLAAMQSVVDPGEAASESQATSLQGEIERLRFALKEHSGKTYWYESPAASLADVATNTSAIATNTSNIATNTSDIATINANNWVTTSRINNSAVTTDKINDDAVTPAKLSSLTASTSSGTYNTTSTSFVATGLSVTLTPEANRLLIISLVPIDATTGFVNYGGVAGYAEGELRVNIGATNKVYRYSEYVSTGSLVIKPPPGLVNTVTTVGTSITISVDVRVTGSAVGGTTMGIQGVQLEVVVA